MDHDEGDHHHCSTPNYRREQVLAGWKRGATRMVRGPQRPYPREDEDQGEDDDDDQCQHHHHHADALTIVAIHCLWGGKGGEQREGRKQWGKGYDGADNEETCGAPRPRPLLPASCAREVCL